LRENVIVGRSYCLSVRFLFLFFINQKGNKFRKEDGNMNKKIKGGIYKIINLCNGKFYIGSSRNLKRRWKEHKLELRKNNHSNAHLQSAWNKYGEENFKFEIIEYIEDIIELKNREQYWIDILKAYDNTIGYNIIRMVNNPYNYTLDTKNKKSILSKGENNPQSKLKEEDIHKIVKMINEGIKNIDIANYFHVSPELISRIKTGDAWKHLITEEIKSQIKIRKVLDINTVILIKKELSKNVKSVDIMKKFNVSKDIVSDIKNNKTWKDVKVEEAV
jgi:group I intron endonuclease